MTEKKENPKDFVKWLSGYLDGACDEENNLPGAKVKVIRDRLDKVFTHDDEPEHAFTPHGNDLGLVRC